MNELASGHAKESIIEAKYCGLVFVALDLVCGKRSE